LIRALPLICLATIIAIMGSANAQNFDGEAHAKDGDDLIVAGKDIRLFGIDAFEFDQKCEAEGKLYPCGVFAQEQLVHKIFGPLSPLRAVGPRHRAQSPGGRLLG
jgi:endonuclease YncB( thermonuclease family)